jgi:hypothetical protein
MRILRPLLGVLALTIVGCSDPLGPVNTAELARAERLWEQKRPASYTIEERISCFCDPVIHYWTRLTVRNDVIVAQEWTEPVPAVYQMVSLSQWSTVPGLFMTIHSSAGAGYTKRIDATYDPTYGYPTRIEVVCDDNIADCGVIYEARNLTPIP